MALRIDRFMSFCFLMGTFDGDKIRFLTLSFGPLSIGPDHTPGFRPGSRID
jgi:hypothetical protein